MIGTPGGPLSTGGPTPSGIKGPTGGKDKIGMVSPVGARSDSPFGRKEIGNGPSPSRFTGNDDGPKDGDEISKFAGLRPNVGEGRDKPGVKDPTGLPGTSPFGKLGPSQSPARAIDFGPYMADLQRRIKRAWVPPKAPSSKRVVMQFTIHTHGELSGLRLVRGSGSGDSDQAAMRAVQNAAPFRPLPDGAPPAVEVEFTFDYNVFSGSGAIR